MHHRNRAPAAVVSGRGRISVSFEFFPPKTEEMERNALGGDRAARAAVAAFRVGDLWRGRLDARAHARDGEAHPQRDRADAGRASDLRRRDARRGRRGGPRLSRCRRAPHRGAARRSGRRRRRSYAPHPGGYAERRRPGRGHQAASPISRCRCRPIRKSIRISADVDADIDMLKAKVDAGATRAITQFFFENDLYFRYLDRVRRARHRHPDRAGHPAGAELQAGRRTSPSACGASVPDWLAARFDGLDDDRGDPQADRRRGRRRAGARPRRSAASPTSTSTR